jgi:hypothetical protein
MVYCKGCAIEKTAFLRKITQKFAHFSAIHQKSLGNFTELREIPQFLNPLSEYSPAAEIRAQNLSGGRSPALRRNSLQSGAAGLL